MNATLRNFVTWVIIVLLLLVVFTLYQPLADRLFIGAGASSQRHRRDSSRHGWVPLRNGSL